LMDCARFYGIFVPSGDTTWEFSHKTLYDYLAARYWVETGKFDPSKIKTWNTRAAYAASIIPDATRSIIAIVKRHNLGLINDLLLNDPNFDHELVATELAKLLPEAPGLSLEIEAGHCYIDGRTIDILESSSSKLLFQIIRAALGIQATNGRALLCYALV